MSGSSAPGPPWLLRVGDRALYALLQAVTHVGRALPTRWVLAVGDAVGDLWYHLDRRARRTGRQNLSVVFGDAMSPAEKARILRASLRGMARSIFMLVHVSPMSSKRYARWVDVLPESRAVLDDVHRRGGGLVGVSGHVGNWELLLGMGNAVPTLPPLMFLAETMQLPALDRLLVELRGSGGGTTALRRGGARALHRHAKEGGCATLLADRNARRDQGGIWVPFLGLQARTTPLPGWIAVRHGVPVLPTFCFPKARGRYEVWVGPDLTEGVDLGDEDAAIYEITRRVNEVIEKVIRAEPELWNWTLKRFKSRPDRELGPYPPYSLWDPDLPARATARP